MTTGKVRVLHPTSQMLRAVVLALATGAATAAMPGGDDKFAGYYLAAAGSCSATIDPRGFYLS